MLTKYLNSILENDDDDVSRFVTFDFLLMWIRISLDLISIQFGTKDKLGLSFK